MESRADTLGQCQFCRSKLLFVAKEVNPGDAVTSVSQPARTQLAPSTRIDESFILLDDALAARRSQLQHDGSGSGRNMEESFMLVGSASVFRQPGTASGAGAAGCTLPAAVSQSTLGRVNLDPVFHALERICDIAEDDSRVQQPICLDCSDKVQKEMESQVREARAELTAYQAALSALSAPEAPEPLSDEDFERRKQELEEQAEQERLHCEELQNKVQAAAKQVAAAEGMAAEVAELEKRYWDAFNDLQLQLEEHVQERGFILAKTDHAQAQLERLRRVNVYNDIFFIWHDGPFGTISGFRLGRTPTIAVEWDEINAAWGQAVLLLNTVAQSCQLSFSYRLIPMGSYPRVADKKTTYDLFGPVSKLYCTSYDRAMTCFLACIKEFAEFAAQRDALAGYRQIFELPYAIDGDKVGGRSIRLMLNKDERWTKALKYMLTNLKWCLEWMVNAQEQQRTHN